MILTIELTDTEYHGLMDSLHEAVIAFGGYRTQSTTRERSVHALELEHLRTLLAEASISDRPTEDDHIVASVYLKGLSDQWDGANVTMDEARDWHKLPPIRQIQVVERMLSVVSLLTSLAEKEGTPA